MLSLIICSRYKDISPKLKNNITETIGTEYELVVIDNSQNKYSIFSAYNEGVRRAKGKYLCFMHDDIQYHTQDWGKKIIAHFKSSRIGIIGVSGGHCMYDTPSSWWDSLIVSKNYIQSNYNPHDKTNNKITFYNHKHQDKDTEEVVAIDGFWFCIPKNLFFNIHFDEQTFKSFHFYDLDICFQIRKLGYSAHVIYDILIEHFSLGSINDDWINSSLLFNNKWKEQLPAIVGVELSQNDYILLCTKHVETELSYFKQLNKTEERLNKVLKSNAYKIGKLLLKSFTLFKTKVT